jgi:Na+-driven multidrug efflux pump
MQTAAATLSGNALGAGDNDRMKRLARTILPLEVGLMTVSGALLFAFARPLMALFSSDEQVIMLGSTVLRMVAVSEPFYGVPIVIEGMMQGVGRTMMPFLFNLAGMWGVRIAGTFVCTWLLGLGLEAAWACMIAHNLLLCLLFSLHFRRGTWNPLNAKKTGAECAP